MITRRSLATTWTELSTERLPAASAPWLLLSVDGRGGTAPFTDARYVQRVRTSGGIALGIALGIAPSSPCDASRVGGRL